MRCLNWATSLMFLPVILLCCGTGGIVWGGTTVSRPAPARECRVRDQDGLVSYAGPCKNGWANGEGVAKYADNSTYEGHFVNGYRQGAGTYVWPAGDRYRGGFARDSMHGRGEKVWANGTVYSGAYKNNLEAGGWLTESSGGRVWCKRNSLSDPMACKSSPW